MYSDYITKKIKQDVNTTTSLLFALLDMRVSLTHREREELGYNIMWRSDTITTIV